MLVNICRMRVVENQCLFVDNIFKVVYTLFAYFESRS